jgi:hypothetical protein
MQVAGMQAACENLKAVAVKIMFVTVLKLML